MLFSLVLTVHVTVFQIEKVLQQGEISDCADPYLTMKESDSNKVMLQWNMTRLRSTLSTILHQHAFLTRHLVLGLSEQGQTGEAARSGGDLLQQAGPLPHAFRLGHRQHHGGHLHRYPRTRHVRLGQPKRRFGLGCLLVPSSKTM